MKEMFHIALILALAGACFGLTPVDVSADAVTPPPDGPTVVRAGIYLVDVGEISETNNTFSVELVMIGGWRDPRLAFDPAAEGRDRRVYIGPASEKFRTSNWNAQITAANSVGNIQLLNQKVTHFSDGTLFFEVGVEALLRANLDYRHFPFDEQVLPVHVESFAWNKNVIIFETDDENTGFDPSFDLPEWRVEEATSVVSEVTRPRDPEPFSRMTFNILIKRKSGFYVWKIFLPLFIIVAISWVTFWMNEEMLGRRAGVSVTGILTVIAYQFVVAGFLPKLSYLTALDKVMLASIVLIALTLVVSIAVDRLRSRVSPEAALRVDKTCRAVFPLTYLAVIVAAVGPTLF